ncbi:hypothetical protein [Pseudoflavonifractor sp. MCC625]|uniref:hypothetical protein n=1 Tax=Pseudoflavonifractor sp. MCC625 TaxID=2592647 RepID=UPI001C012A2C|nr:hypothetical protein [Pseudoflavonifractor sp. MCC625]MBT9685038.1 hypothetical protein [Pseudoflavonifractor sp. MCC625]
MTDLEKNISCLSKLGKRPFLLMILVIVLLFIIIMTSIYWKYSVDFNIEFGEGIHFILTPPEPDENNLQEENPNLNNYE